MVDDPSNAPESDRGQTETDARAVVLDVWARGRKLSAVGPGDLELHWDHAARMAAGIDPVPSRALDLGSGAGIPGLALAALWPACHFTLLEASARRVRLLHLAVMELGWVDRVEVAHGRAELLARRESHRQSYDLVTARLFGGPAATAECGVGFLRPNGRLVVAEPPSDPTGEDDGGRWPPEGLSRLGLTARGRRGGAQHLELVGALPEWVPRRDGVPAHRPLF